MDINLIILIWVSVVSIILITIFLIKLLYDLSDLTKSMTKGSEMLQNEIEPTLKELNEAVASLNKVSGIAKEHVERIQKTIHNITNGMSAVGGKIQGLFSGLSNGIQFGLKLFRK